MTPQEVERTIEFLLQHQAAVEARQDRTDAQIAALSQGQKTLAREMNIRDRKLSEKIERIADSVQTLRDAIRDLFDHARWTDARLSRLEQSEG